MWHPWRDGVRHAAMVSRHADGASLTRAREDEPRVVAKLALYNPIRCEEKVSTVPVVGKVGASKRPKSCAFETRSVAGLMRSAECTEAA